MALNNFKLLSLERGESIKHLAITKNPPFIEWILNGRDVSHRSNSLGVALKLQSIINLHQ